MVGFRFFFICFFRYEGVFFIFVIGVGDIGVAKLFVSFINFSFNRFYIRSW